MKYNNDEIDNDLTSYYWFEGEKQSHFTVNKSMIANIHSAAFFPPLIGRTEKFYTHKSELMTLLFALILQAS